MGKRSKESEGGVKDVSKKSKKQKQTQPEKEEPAVFSLFGKARDAELDDIFSKGAAYAVTPSANFASSSKTPISAAANVKGVRNASEVSVPAAEEEEADSGDEEEEEGDEVGSQVDGESENEEGYLSADAELSEGSEELDEGEDLDIDAEAPTSIREAAAESSSSSDEDTDEDESSTSELVHESLKSSNPKPKPSSSRYTPPNETTSDRNRRTIFLGNLPISLTSTKTQQSQLRAHLLTYAPTAKIESIRFRSIPFAKPTGGLGEDGEEEGKRLKREKERARVWREGQEVLKGGDEKAKEEVDKSKSYIDSKGKRKVAFIKKEFHTEAGSCNAYVVFAHPHPDRPSNVAPILDPYEAALKCLAANGSTLLNRTIRVDAVTKTSEGIAPTVPLKKGEGWVPVNTDPKKSIFVGGLDYAAKEEDLRVLFETLVTGERGEREGAGKWVESVRIIRDKQTQLGKGFGYVHFSDRTCVDEMLAIDIKKLKLAKRPLRVQRCKILPTQVAKHKPVKPTSTSTSTNPKSGLSKSKFPTKASSVPAKRRVSFGPAPKGNPELGEKIRGLSKDERKVAKASDADRQARRMAKKAAKAAGAVRGDKEKGAVKLGGERRGKKFDASKKGAKKGRGRSDNAVAKMKGARV